jgi:hypothetical protein
MTSRFQAQWQWTVKCWMCCLRNIANKKKCRICDDFHGSPRTTPTGPTVWHSHSMKRIVESNHHVDLNLTVLTLSKRQRKIRQWGQFFNSCPKLAWTFWHWPEQLKHFFPKPVLSKRYGYDEIWW